MAIVSVLTCTRCENLILPGDRIGLITSGVFGGVNAENGESVLTEASENTQELCEDCTAAVVTALRIAMDELSLLSDDTDDGEEDEPEPFVDPKTVAGYDTRLDLTCVGTDRCCTLCATPGRCCAGFPEKH